MCSIASSFEAVIKVVTMLTVQVSISVGGSDSGRTEPQKPQSEDPRYPGKVNEKRNMYKNTIDISTCRNVAKSDSTFATPKQLHTLTRINRDVNLHPSRPLGLTLPPISNPPIPRNIHPKRRLPRRNHMPMVEILLPRRNLPRR